MNLAVFNAWGILFKGGPMMWPIFLLSLVALTIAFEKIAHLNRVQKNLMDAKQRILQAIKENRMKDAVSLCEENAPLIGPILKAGILKFGATRDVIVGAMEQAAVGQIHGLKQRMGILGLITNAAPLLGLLGTVTGMCVVFHAVQMRSNSLNPLPLGDMSSGIWQALLTSAAGIAVGVIALCAHSFCAQRINDVIVDVEAGILETANVLQSIGELER